jgi:hypothetical protein
MFSMTRRQSVVAGTILLALLIAAFAIYAANRRAAFERAAPDWLDPQQPPEGIAAQGGTVSPAASWAANRCVPLTGCCTGRSAGSRVKRYPATLAESPGSFIRASFDLSGGC